MQTFVMLYTAWLECSHSQLFKVFYPVVWLHKNVAYLLCKYLCVNEPNYVYVDILRINNQVLIYHVS